MARRLLGLIAPIFLAACGDDGGGDLLSHDRAWYLEHPFKAEAAFNACRRAERKVEAAGAEGSEAATELQAQCGQIRSALAAIGERRYQKHLAKLAGLSDSALRERAEPLLEGAQSCADRELPPYTAMAEHDRCDALRAAYRRRFGGGE